MDKFRFCLELIRTGVPIAILTIQILMYYQ
jgi:hypothetical protein